MKKCLVVFVLAAVAFLGCSKEVVEKQACFKIVGRKVYQTGFLRDAYTYLVLENGKEVWIAKSGWRLESGGTLFCKTEFLPVR